MWRSLVAHLTGGQGVVGSNPAIPTNKIKGFQRLASAVGSGVGKEICTDCTQFRDDGSGLYRCKCTHRKLSHLSA